MKVLSFSIKKFYVRFGLVSDYDIGGMILSPYALNLIDDSIAPILLGVTILEAAIMGSVMAAVSPAVIVPRMIKLMEEGDGTKKSIPQLILTVFLIFHWKYLIASIKILDECLKSVLTRI